MNTKEDRIRADIITKYGSIPKMAKEIGVPQNTIYHALERGLDNTIRKTSSSILEALYGKANYSFVNLDDDAENELVDLFRKLSPRAQKALLAGLREYVNHQAHTR